MIEARLIHVRGSRSQADMAAYLGVHKNTYARWERGEREIGAEALALLVQAGWSGTWLLIGEGPERQDDVDSTGEGGTQHLDPATLAHATSVLLGVLDDDGTDLTHTDFGAAVLDIYAAMHNGGRQALTQAVARAAAKAQKQNG